MITPDRHTIIQVLGGLMNKPELLSETDKYLLEVSDFPLQLDKFIFSAIYNLYLNGAERIHVSDIDNYLKENQMARQLMEKENGIIFLQDCEVESEVENFNYYYNKLKKINLVRELQFSKDKIDDIYCEDPLNENCVEINNRFETMQTSDIVNMLKSKVANIENKYVLNNQVEEGRPIDNIKSLLEDLKEKPEVGCRLQGDIFNAISRGARRGKLYLRSASSGIGKSRNLVGDACYIAYPVRFDVKLNRWISTGSCEKVLYVMTEQDTEEIDTMILAYLTGYNEEIFLYGQFTEKEMERINIAVEIMEQFKDNFHYVKVADPTSAIIKNLFRRYSLQYGVEYFFYDYVFSSPSLLNEYKDIGIPEHVALRLLMTTLKNLAYELNAFVITSTQLNAEDDPKGGFKDYHYLQGSKSVKDLCDLACIMSRPTNDELNKLVEFKKAFGYTPNLVTDVYKNRRGRWTMVRIWSYMDLGTCRKQDLFITTANMKPVDGFIIIDFKTENEEQLKDWEKLYNHGEVTDVIYENLTLPETSIDSDNIMENLSEAFGNKEDKLQRLKDRDISDML